MAGVVHGDVSFPGVTSLLRLDYTISHGIAPGVAVMTIAPQATLPAEFGSLILTDGVNGRVILPDCKVDLVNASIDESGQEWHFNIADRRWKWAFGSIYGLYNQLDPHGKLMAWTIRSPQELAALCLDEMGEKGYDVSLLPPGLPRAVGLDISTFLPTGLNFPPTGTNPCVDWNGLPPAQALQQLCDLFLCRVVWRLSTNTVLITPVGIGNDLPTNLSIHKEGPAVNAPQAPSAVRVLGTPTRSQMELDIVAYGEEWDGTFRPINELSYAPVNSRDQPQVSKYTFTADGTAGVVFRGSLYFDDTSDPTTGTQFTYTTVGAASGTTVATAIKNAINASDVVAVKNGVTASNVAGVLTITGKKNGIPFPAQFAITSAAPPAGNSVTGSVTQVARLKGPSWRECPPPDFFSVVAVPGRLTYQQAREKAQRSVWKVYRLSGIDVSVPVGDPPIPPLVPGYGPVLRIQQIVLQDTQVLQVTPQPLDDKILEPDLQPLTINFYNGYSRDKPAAVYGSVNQAFFTDGVLITNQSANSGSHDQVFITFSTDPIYQQITFSNYAYFHNIADGGCDEPLLTLDTAVLVRDPDTNQFLVYQQDRPVPGGSPNTLPLARVYPDVQLNVYGVYDDQGNLLQTVELNTDARQRANYYLNGMIAQYFLSGGLVLEYNGIIGPANGLDLDGAIQQITWHVSTEGCSTTASKNCEHNIYVPPLPARRFPELLDGIIQDKLKSGRSMMSGFELRGGVGIPGG